MTKEVVQTVESHADLFEEMWGSKGTEKHVVEEEDEVLEAVPEEEEVPAAEAPETVVEDNGNEVSAEAPAAAAADKKEEPSNAPADPYAWIGALPEEVKAHAEKLKNSAASDKGRVVQFRRELASLRQELESVKAQSRTPSPAAQTPPEGKSAPAATKLPEKFTQLKEEFPQFADAVEELRASDREEFQTQLSQALAPLEERLKIEKRNEFERAVDAGAKDIFQSDEEDWHWKNVVAGEDFNAWLLMQPKSVQLAASIGDPQEALFVLGKYKTDYDEAVADMLAAEGATSTSTTKADDVMAKREKRKATSVAPASKVVPSDNATSGLTDYHAEFDRMWGGKSRK